MRALRAEIMPWDHALRSCFESLLFESTCFCATHHHGRAQPCYARPPPPRLERWPRSSPSPATLLRMQESRAITSRCASSPLAARSSPPLHAPADARHRLGPGSALSPETQGRTGSSRASAPAFALFAASCRCCRLFSPAARRFSFGAASPPLAAARHIPCYNLCGQPSWLVTALQGRCKLVTPLQGPFGYKAVTQGRCKPCNGL